MGILTVDFETYYSSTYSLSKITTEEYLRSSEFEVIGVSVAVDDSDPVWFSGTHAKIKNFLEGFPWSDSIAVAHNAMFDMAILEWHFGMRPKRIVDTLSMARALHANEVSGSLKALVAHYSLGEKGNEVMRALGKKRMDFSPEELAAYGSYCCNDTALTYQLFTCLAVDFPVSELRLIDLTVRMFTEPVLELDRGKLVHNAMKVASDKEFLLKHVEATKVDLMSNLSLASILRELGVTPPMKISPTTGKETYAFAKNDEEFLALLEHHETSVQALVAARLGLKSTLEETRTQRFLDIARRGSLPVPLRYYAAHTGRWGGDDKINLQNLGRKSAIKYAILAPEGHLLLNSDSSQIEARTLAWLAEQADLVEAFERGDDVYVSMASRIYGDGEEHISAQQRHVGKTVILGCGYGVGAEKLRGTLKTGQIPVEVPLLEAQKIIDTYRTTYARIPALWDSGTGAIKAMLRGRSSPLGREGVLSVEGKKGIKLPNGLYLRYPSLRKEKNIITGQYEYIYDNRRGRNKVATKLYGGKLIENVTQALARIVVGEQMLMISRKYKVAMTVHDSVVAVVPEHEAERAKEFVEIAMRLRPSWAPDLPLNCKAGVGSTYGNC
jgi:DNA polymerase